MHDGLKKISTDIVLAFMCVICHFLNMRRPCREEIQSEVALRSILVEDIPLTDTPTPAQEAAPQAVDEQSEDAPVVVVSPEDMIFHQQPKNLAEVVNMENMKKEIQSEVALPSFARCILAEDIPLTATPTPAEKAATQAVEEQLEGAPVVVVSPEDMIFHQQPKNLAEAVSIENMKKEIPSEVALRSFAGSILAEDIPVTDKPTPAEEAASQAVDERPEGAPVVVSPEDMIFHQQTINLVEAGNYPVQAGNYPFHQNQRCLDAEAERELKAWQPDYALLKEIMFVSIIILTLFLLVVVGNILYFALGYQTENETTPITDIDFTTPMTDMVFDVTTPMTDMDFDVNTPMTDMDFDVNTPMTDMDFDVTTPMTDMNFDVFIPGTEMDFYVTTPVAEMDLNVTTPMTINNFNVATPMDVLISHEMHGLVPISMAETHLAFNITLHLPVMLQLQKRTQEFHP